MTRIKYDAALMKTMSIFENVTRSKIKDSFIDDHGQMVFVVREGEISKAIGKGGQNVKKLEKMLNRKIKIVEFNPQLLRFVRNLIHPIKVKDVEEADKIVTITGFDTRSKGLLIGKGAQNLRNYTQIVKRYFEIEEIKVI